LNAKHEEALEREKKAERRRVSCQSDCRARLTRDGVRRGLSTAFRCTC
jgi:hypothetical protein